MTSHIFETYNNSVRSHSNHIHKTKTETYMLIMFPFPYDLHALPHWKCVLRCFSQCPSTIIPGQKSKKDKINTCSTVSFHVYRNLSRCTFHE